MAGEKILVVEDDPGILRLLSYNLEKEGYLVTTAADGEAGLEAFEDAKPDMIVLDIMLPKLDGFEFCRTVRRGAQTPILMLTAKRDAVDRVHGLELGADDYVVKPFSMREIVARVKAILRRTAGPVSDGQAGVLRAGKLEVDLGRHEARLDGRALELRSKELDFLRCLLEARGKALSRERLLELVWGPQKALDIDSRTVDQNIARLRDKLGREAGRLITVKNVGYRLDLD